MGIGTAFFVYLLVWWMMLFTVLPIGVVRNTDTNKGHDAGAPVDPMLKKKLIINSILSAVVVGVIWILVSLHIITWDAWFREAIR